MRRRYYRVKKVYPKQKWLPVNNEVNIASDSNLGYGGFKVTVQPITENPSRNTANGEGNVSSASILKCGRFRFKGIIDSLNTTSDVNYIIGISYIPEGYIINQNSTSVDSLGETFFYRHPEWILAWTRMDYANDSQNNEIRLFSKLKRNLNSGDQIVVFRIAINRSTSSSLSVSAIRGTVSYVCRSN